MLRRKEEGKRIGGNITTASRTFALTVEQILLAVQQQNWLVEGCWHIAAAER